MLVAENSKIFVSDRDLKCHYVEVENIFGNEKDFFVLFIDPNRQFNFSPIKFVDLVHEKQTYIHLKFKTFDDSILDITVNQNCKIYTKNHDFVLASQLSLTDLVVDDRGRVCKLIKKEYSLEEAGVAYIEPFYGNKNVFCNGIAVKNWK